MAFFEVVNLKNYPRAFKIDFSDNISKILFTILGINNKTIARKYLPFALAFEFKATKILYRKGIAKQFQATQ